MSGLLSPPPLAVLCLPSKSRDRAVVRERLTRAGGTVDLASDVPDAIRMLVARDYAVVVVDLAAGDRALGAIRVLRAQSASIPIAGLMDPADPVTAAAAIDAGAGEILPWPLANADVARAYAAVRDRQDAGEAPAIVEPRLVAHSPAMRAVMDGLRAADSRTVALLVTGAPGSGRTLVARTRHALDGRGGDRPFVVVDCATGEGQDLERTLFGASRRQGGRRESVERASSAAALVAAQHGTLVLKNLPAAPAPLQVRLTGALRDREVLVDSDGACVALDVRVIAIGAPDVAAAVADGRLRRDLFQRVSGVRVEVPSFDRRREDLPLLLSQFLQQASGGNSRRFSRAALAVLAAMSWKGNAREMSAVVNTLARNARAPLIQLDDVLDQVSLDAGGDGGGGEALTLRDARVRFEREFISRALIRADGRAGDAARTLGIQRTNLYRKVRQLRVSKALLSRSR